LAGGDSRFPITTLCGICAGRSGFATGFLEGFAFILPIIQCPALPAEQQRENNEIRNIQTATENKHIKIALQFYTIIVNKNEEDIRELC
jgi:hypothetical protein